MVGQDHVFAPVLMAHTRGDAHVERGLYGFTQKADIPVFQLNGPAAVLDSLEYRIPVELGLFVIIDP